MAEKSNGVLVCGQSLRSNYLILKLMFLFFLSLKCFELDEETLESREVVDVDIAYDELPEKHYVPEEVRYGYVIHVINENLHLQFGFPCICMHNHIQQFNVALSLSL